MYPRRIERTGDTLPDGVRLIIFPLFASMVLCTGVYPCGGAPGFSELDLPFLYWSVNKNGPSAPALENKERICAARHIRHQVAE